MAVPDSLFCPMIILTWVFLGPILGLSIPACVNPYWLEYNSDDGNIKAYAGFWDFNDDRYSNGTKYSNQTHLWDMPDFSKQGKCAF